MCGAFSGFCSLPPHPLLSTVYQCDGCPGLEINKMSGRKFATSYENLVATLKMLVAKLIEAI